jgi:hypothetical protein
MDELFKKKISKMQLKNKGLYDTSSTISSILKGHKNQNEENQKMKVNFLEEKEKILQSAISPSNNNGSTININTEENQENENEKNKDEKVEKENEKNEEEKKKEAIVFPMNKKRKRKMILDDDDNKIQNKTITFIQRKVDKLTPLPSLKNSNNILLYKSVLKNSVMQRRFEYNTKLRRMKTIESKEKEIKYIQRFWRLYFKNNILKKIILIQSYYKMHFQMKKIHIKMKLYLDLKEGINVIKNKIWEKYFDLFINLLKNRKIKKEDIGIQVEILKEEIIHKSICLKTFPRPYHEIGNNISYIQSKINRKNYSLDISINKSSQILYEGKTGKLICYNNINSEKIRKSLKINSFRKSGINIFNNNERKTFFNNKNISNRNYDIINNVKYVNKMNKRIIFKKWFFTSKIDNYNEIKKLYLIQKAIKKYLKKLKAQKINQSKRNFHIKLFIVLLINNITKNIRINIVKMLKYKYDTIIKYIEKNIQKNPSLKFIEVRRGVKHERSKTSYLNFQSLNKPISVKEQTSSTIINDETIYVNVKYLNNKYITAIKNSIDSKL